MSYSWGNYCQTPQRMTSVFWRSDNLASLSQSGNFLPYGLGRSYGDSCLNSQGILLGTRNLNHFIAFNKNNGVLKLEAGVSLRECLQFIVPQGWFLPTSPGTQFVTIGGAIANDIHGKNHHKVGSFGNHILRLCLLKSSGEKVICSQMENTELFQATVGGLGLTGLIVWAEIQLTPIVSTKIKSQVYKLKNVDAFFEKNDEMSIQHDYSVAWVDSTAKGRHLGRGWLLEGNFSKVPEALSPINKKQIEVPFQLPFSLINKMTVKAFNELYSRKHLSKTKEVESHYEPFFYPLDGVRKWNRLYGKKGFLQYQCVVPLKDSRIVVSKLLQMVAKSKAGSFLTVLKKMGNIPSHGFLSFSRPGITFAIDFPFQGEETLLLFNKLDEIVMSAGGALYPAKDARMSRQSFRSSFPQFEKMKRHIDPQISSDFWTRISGD